MPPRPVLVLILVASMFGLLAPLASMLLTGVVVELVAAAQPRPVKVALVATGTVTGAAGAGWAAQPLLTRLSARLSAWLAGRGAACMNPSPSLAPSAMADQDRVTRFGGHWAAACSCCWPPGSSAGTAGCLIGCGYAPNRSAAEPSVA
ncbi:MAG TPA: hypothetical protein VFC19_05345 [Candidatus Limnocylindrales bacterium]|nr:hypothetical protein [Candidatus Limnocylindrales bacterium]